MNAEIPGGVKAISKAQEEVWEWKEALARETEHMSVREMLEYIIASSEETVEKIKAAQKAKAIKASE